MEYTKGEWQILSDGLTIKAKIEDKPHYDAEPPQTLIAKCFQNGHLGRSERPTKEDFANAQLIASAPKLKQQRDDLLEACKEAQKVFGFIAENYKSAPHFPNAERLVESAIANYEA